MVPHECTLCEESKPEAEFYRRSGDSNRIRSQCKSCVNEQARIRHSRNPDIARAAMLRQLYDMTLDDFNQMLEDQGGVCAICGLPERWGNRALSVDHDHITKQVRQLLCHSCNTGIGHFKEDERLLQKAIEYIRRHNGS